MTGKSWLRERARVATRQERHKKINYYEREIACERAVALRERHEASSRRARLNLQENRDACQGPLGGLVTGLQIERPNVRRTARSGPVDRTFVHVLRLLLVLRDRLHKHDRQQKE